MKVHLIVPPHSYVDRYDKKVAKAAGTLPPLGILYIAAVLEKNGYKVSVTDGSKEDYYHMQKKIRKEKPDIVGVSSMTFLWNKAKKLISELKEEVPETFIVAGGPHPTIYKKRCLEESPLLDGVIVGEGEFAMLELVEKLEKGNPLKNVNGLIYRDGGKIVENPPRPLIPDLDALPLPARGLIDILDYVPAPEQYKVRPVTNMMGSRGCPFRCIYCSKITGNTVRFRSPQNMVDEIEELVNRYGIKEIAFFDDTFTVNKKRVIEFTKLLKQSGLDIVWCAHARVNTVDKELLKSMADTGCWRLFYGIESMLQKNMDTLKKGITVDQAYNAIKWTRDIGIESEASFMFGIPGETHEDALKTIELIKKLNPDYAKFFPITPIPGTELYDNIDKYGKFVSENLDDFTEYRVVFTPHSMTKEELEKIVPLAYKEFYLRPSYILKYIKRIRSFEGIKRGIRGAKAVISI